MPGIIHTQLQGAGQAIVFGGAGFIVSHLLKTLAAGNPEMRLFSVDIAQPRFRTPAVTYLRHDLRTPIPAGLCGGEPAVIFNLAAVHVTPGHQDWEYYWTNVLAAAHVCHFAAGTGSNQLCFTSSISVYGPSEEPKDEETQPNPVSAYGRSKLLAEKVHEQWQAEDSASRSLTIVRPAVIYGLYERGNFTRLARLLAKGRFVYPARKDTIKSCGYVKDLVASLMHMKDRTSGTMTYNFCYPERTSTEEVCAAFCETAGYARPRLVAPRPLMMTAAMGFEALAAAGMKTSVNRDRLRKLIMSTNIIPKRLQEAQFPFLFDLRTSLADWKAASPSGEFD